MKKTIITLLALGATAMGITLEDATSVTTNGTISVAKQFTVALTLDVEALRGILEAGETKQFGSNIVVYHNSDSTTQTGVVVNGSSNSAGKITSSGLYARWGTDTAWNPNQGSDVRWDGGTDLAAINWDNVASAGLTYIHKGISGGGSYSAVAFTLLGVDGSTILDGYVQAAGLGTGSVTEGFATMHSSVVSQTYYYASAANEADAKALATLAATAAPAVPEPTTATLSLLALAGLAARRRRH